MRLIANYEMAETSCRQCIRQVSVQSDEMKPLIISRALQMMESSAFDFRTTKYH